ncbi:MAG: nucleotidyltransferase family protein [Alphaproteobacteria bacterium]|nr:nucleotidyltransferase family protein [Alphaproteobacteria bacterium]
MTGATADARITSAMVLAAGIGKRMRPLSDSCPKPLLKVCGRTMLDHSLDRLAAVGVKEAVVNTHHLGTLVAGHLSTRKGLPRIHLSPEDELLETGGGVAEALRRFPTVLGGGPFYVANGDVIWLDGASSALGRMAAAWDDGAMDALLLLHATVSAFGYDGPGDFMMDGDGRIRRAKPLEVLPFLYTGVQVLHPRLFAGAPPGAFSLNRLYDAAIEAGRLWGIRHDGIFYHVGTPRALDFADRTLQDPEMRAAFF